MPRTRERYLLLLLLIGATITEAAVAAWTIEDVELSRPREDYSTVVLGDMVFFAGGRTPRGAVDTVDIYEASRGTWSQAALSEPRCLPATLINMLTAMHRTRTDRQGQQERLPTTDEGGLSDMEKEVVQEIMNQTPVLAITKRINAQLAVLRHESLEQSLAKLDEVESYYWPGTTEREPGIPCFPLDPAGDRWDIESITSNRRFLKVYQGLSAISKREAETLLNKELQGALSQYQSLLAQYMLEHKSYFDSVKSGIVPTTGPALHISNNKDGSPTLAGTRLKILSLLLIAGDLHLDGSRATVRTVTTYALEQNRQLQADPFNCRLVSISVSRLFSLYNRRILATGALGTSLTPAKEGQVLETVFASRQEIALTHYDAAATRYDLHSQAHAGPIPVDYSKGKLVVRCVTPIDDPTLAFLLGRQEVDIK